MPQPNPQETSLGIPSVVAARLRARREERGISARGLAKEVGCSPSLISQIETSKANPSVATLYAIVSALDVSLDELFADPEPNNGNRPPTAAQRIESGMVNPKRDWVDMADVIRGSVERARKYFPGHDIDVSIASNLPLIRGDSVLLGQVLFNLIDNAIKYGGKEPVAIYARRDGQAVAVSVTDMGRGIPAGELERIFEKFYRRSGKADGRTAGTGLGLAIARGFVEAMGGAIKAESPAVKKRGTRLVLRFPLQEMSETGEKTVERPPNPDRR